MTFKLLARCLIIFLGLAPNLPGASAQAKELFGRVGLGYNAQFANTALTNGVPAISIKYGLAPRAMLELVGGFYSGSNGSGVFGVKYMQTLRSESYANFYFLVGGAAVSANHRSGAEFLLGLGSEFFIPGVDNVGISFEAGMSAENISQVTQSFVVKTFGASFINAGMHYYF
jgi:hypothetical protein